MGTSIRIAGTVSESIVDGPGIRLVVFTQGCPHHCEGCHNPHTHAYDGGYLMDIDEIVGQAMENPLLDGITLSGGEPFEQALPLSELAQKIKNLGLNVMTYTGYTFEYLIDKQNNDNGYGKLLSFTDILVDGKFELSQRNMLLRFRGSDNQRFIDVKKSLQTHQVVLGDG